MERAFPIFVATNGRAVGESATRDNYSLA